MAVVKILIAGLCALAGMGAIAFAVLEVPRVAPGPSFTLSAVALREFPQATGALAHAAPSPSAVNDDLEPMRQLAPRDAGAAAVAVAEARDAGANGDAGAPLAKDAGVARPAVDAGRPAAPARPDAGVRAPPPPPVGDGLLNLQASDTADVYVDGRKVGSSPIMGFKVKAGTHKIRFDCYDEAGNTVTGTVKTVTLAADQEEEITWTCVTQ